MLLGFFIPHDKCDVVSYPRCQPEVAVHLKEIIINSTASIPVWERLCLTIEEASAYSLIGENRLRQIIENNQHADFILQIGNRTRIKRKEFETYVSGLVSV